jgi:CAAX protease family protein
MFKKKILVYILISYGISWAIWLPNIIWHNFTETKHIRDWLHLVGGLGPMFSAIITTTLFGKAKDLRLFISNRFMKIPKIRIILMGIGMPMLFAILSALTLFITTGKVIRISELGYNSKIPVSNPFFIWIIWIIFFGVGEETGWRGFLFPELIKKFKAGTSAFYTALIWASWHIPLFLFDKDLSTLGLLGTFGWLIGLICGSLLFGWLVKKSNWNLLPVILWHGTFNFFTASEKTGTIFQGLMSMMVVVVVIWIFKKYNSNFAIRK